MYAGTSIQNTQLSKVFTTLFFAGWFQILKKILSLLNLVVLSTEKTMVAQVIKEFKSVSGLKIFKKLATWTTVRTFCACTHIMKHVQHRCTYKIDLYKII